MQVDTTGASSQTASQDNLLYSGEAACYGDIMQVDTTGASSQTASQDNLLYSGEFIFVCFGRSCVRFY